MQKAGKLEYKEGTREEELPGFDPAFPCITTCYEIPRGDAAPWHWHPAVELFYISEGTLEYITPNRHLVFSAGSGGIVMPNIPHRTIGSGGIQLLHLFEPVLISGHIGSRMEAKYVLPLTAGEEMILLDPGKTDHLPILDRLRESFRPEPEETGYELILRNALSSIWLELLRLQPDQGNSAGRRASALIRQMLIYIREHHREKLNVETLAKSVHISPRMCYKLFQKHLQVSPMAYVNHCRVQSACRMLRQTEAPISEIAAACGFRNGSYFTQVFQEATGLTPREYRKQVQQEEIA